MPNLLWPAPRPRPRLGRDGDVLCSSMWRTASNTALMLVERLSTRSYWCTTASPFRSRKNRGLRKGILRVLVLAATEEELCSSSGSPPPPVLFFEVAFVTGWPQPAQ